LFLRFFHIVLVATYFFCCYAQVIGAPFISSLKERAYTTSKNNLPAKTHFISEALPKHINTFSQVKIENHSPDIWADNLLSRAVVIFFWISSADNIYKITLESPLNKAPPFFS
jgi:hypothetical protein